MNTNFEHNSFEESSGKQNATLKQLKLLVSVLMLTMLVVVAGMWLVFDKYGLSLKTGMVKTDSLYSEVGDVRSDNMNLYLTLKKTQAELDTLHATLENLNDKLAHVEGDDVSSITLDLQSISKYLHSKDLSKAEAPVEKVATEPKEQVSLVYPEGVVNFLLVGMNKSLTDTIMVASVNPLNSTVSLLSIPRDLYVNGRRINVAYYYHGVDKLKSEVQDITGLKIHHHAIVDLNAFVEIVDVLGGLDVVVEKSIYDRAYPTPQKGYQVFSLEAGERHLDGATALKFARSRKSTSDFDRAKRQQQIIEAVKAKIGELDLSKNTKKAVEMYNRISTHLNTDVDVFSALAYLKMFKSYEIERGHVIDNTNFLYSTINVSGAYILLPRGKSYDAVKAFIYDLVVR